MAGMKSIDEARDVLEDAALLTTQMVQAFRDLLEVSGAETPPWLFLLGQFVSDWDAASQAYMMAVHHHARPVLNDLEKLTR